jgi:4-hydroxy 2-oxovalerate aldolase
MELLLGFLRNPKFDLRPIIGLLQDHIEPLRADFPWGALIPYNITGQLNLHPRSAMEFLGTKKNEDILGFYDSIMADF